MNMLPCSHAKTGNSKAGAEFLDMILAKVLNYSLSVFILIDDLFLSCVRLKSYYYQHKLLNVILFIS